MPHLEGELDHLGTARSDAVNLELDWRGGGTGGPSGLVGAQFMAMPIKEMEGEHALALGQVLGLEPALSGEMPAWLGIPEVLDLCKARGGYGEGLVILPRPKVGPCRRGGG